MMSDLLQDFIKSTLSEITRYEEETGEMYDFKKEIRKYITKSHPTRYAFTMTQIPKVGINPGTSYNTPAGVYAFQMNLAYYRRLLDNNLPFVTNAPYCNIMKLNLNAGKWLITSKKGLDRSTDADLEAAKQKVGPEVYTMAQRYGSHWSYGNDCKIFDLTYYATKNKPRSTVAWTSLLRELGYIGVYDPGNGVLHPNEPMQMVCLDQRAYEWIETYETREIRKEKRPAQWATKTQSSKSNVATKEWAESWDANNWGAQAKARKVLQGQIKADPEVLKMTFDKFPGRDKFQDITVNRSAPQELLKKVIDEILPLAREQLKHGYTGYSTHFKNIYLHPNCPPEAWDYIDLFLNTNTMNDVMSSPKMPADVVTDLYQKMTKGKSLDDATEFAHTMGDQVRRNLQQLLQNPNIPQDILKQALQSKDTATRNLAWNNPNLPQEFYEKALNKILDPATHIADRRTLAERVKLKPEDALKVIDSMKDETIRQNLLRNTKFTSSALDSLTKKYTKVQDLTAIMSNRNVSLETLRRLTHDPNSQVSSVAKNKVENYRKYGPPE